jgi:hypothetical protein
MWQTRRVFWNRGTNSLSIMQMPLQWHMNFQVVAGPRPLQR